MKKLRILVIVSSISTQTLQSVLKPASPPASIPHPLPCFIYSFVLTTLCTHHTVTHHTVTENYVLSILPQPAPPIPKLHRNRLLLLFIYFVSLAHCYTACMWNRIRHIIAPKSLDE